MDKRISISVNSLRRRRTAWNKYSKDLLKVQVEGFILKMSVAVEMVSMDLKDFYLLQFLSFSIKLNSYDLCFCTSITHWLMPWWVSRVRSEVFSVSTSSHVVRGVVSTISAVWCSLSRLHMRRTSMLSMPGRAAALAFSALQSTSEGTPSSTMRKATIRLCTTLYSM